ncbi:MFS transporter [Lacticaseibacillus saniviri]|uniref:Nucleotide pyrophosphatase n=1 Tax=Lacticaseibacillus saniviri JCM 17471 = DSM 24301 TaxID=1293598 RepID=A0A0R2MTF7_9LACO|nr:MFS transporter [Lacticaseibacillus saniviri]KRO16904.1 nucleotide pyrophosphatase [Lacticaseibacillus saniviri JCM 17471 = DSM 24301]MCG4282279.1 MFS transporter [Lacticaseibacillus saniviri]
MKKFSKAEWSWIFYDWAQGGFSIVIVTAILPIYFKSVAHQAGLANSTATAYWGYANSLSTLLISLMAPLLGALADYRPNKKRMFVGFSVIGMLFTLLMNFTGTDQWFMLLVLYALGSIGYAGANIFYDGFLVDVAEPDRMDRVSSFGFGIGYIGMVIPFLIVMILQLTSGFGMLDSLGIVHVGFWLTAIWWVVFSIPFYRNVHQVHSLPPVKHQWRESWQRVIKTIGTIWQNKPIMWFLVAYFFYIDGVDTIFKVATSFGVDLGLTTTQLMLMLLMVQLVAIPCTLGYSWLAHRFGTNRAILLAISVYIVIAIYGLMMHSVTDFFILGFLVGTSQGGIQALSRSYFAKLVPAEAANEYFGFYNIFGRFSAIFGPLLFGIVTQVFHNSQLGIASLAILFIIGGGLFLHGTFKVRA